MLSQPPIWLILIAFVAAIGPLVFIHELGHYLVARAFGIGAEVFSIGFGREIVGWTDRRGTRWKVGWLPLGGYVRFVGDMNAASQARADEDLSPHQRRVAFHNKPVWQRFLVVLAGPLANFALAIAIFAAFFALFGMPSTPNVVADVKQASAAAQAGIQPGDRILSIAGEGTARFEDIRRIVAMRPGQPVEIRFMRDQLEQSVTATLDAVDEVDDFGQKYRIGLLGITQTRGVLEKVSPLNLLPAAVVQTGKLTKAMIDGLGQVLVGDRSTKELGGPLKMAQVAGQTATLGPFSFVQLLAFFSINLGFINLLPVPMLDGGHLMFYGIEAARRRPLSEKAQDWAFRGGLALLLGLLFFTTANDLVSFGLGDRLHRLIG